jgi:hypothetical protein
MALDYGLTITSRVTVASEEMSPGLTVIGDFCAVGVLA